MRRTSGRAQAEGPTWDPAFLPSAPGRHPQPGSRTRRPPNRCRGPGKPQFGVSAASSSSTAPWRDATGSQDPRVCRQPCGPGTRDPEEGGACGTHRLRGGGACGTLGWRRDPGFIRRARPEGPTNFAGDGASTWLDQWAKPEGRTPGRGRGPSAVPAGRRRGLRAIPTSGGGMYQLNRDRCLRDH